MEAATGSAQRPSAAPLEVNRRAYGARPLTATVFEARSIEGPGIVGDCVDSDACCGRTPQLTCGRIKHKASVASNRKSPVWCSARYTVREVRRDLRRRA